MNKNRSYYDLIILDLGMPILDGYEASIKINDYLKSSHLTDIV